MSTEYIKMPNPTFHFHYDTETMTEKEDYKKFHQLLSDEKPLCWLFAGDSLTHGCCHTGYHRNYVEYFEAYIKTTSPYKEKRSHDIVINTGNSGATTEDMVNFFDSWIAIPDLDLAFLCFATNDCCRDHMTVELFRKNLSKAISYFRKHNILPILQTPNPSKEQEQQLPYIEATRDLAKEESVLLIDVNRIWRENEEMLPQIMSDPTHPNAVGHLFWCQFLLGSLSMLKENSVLASLDYKSIAEFSSYAKKEESDKSTLPIKTVEQFHSILHNEHPVTILFTGGSIANGLTDPITERNYTQHFEEMIRWEKSNGSMILRSKKIINTARSFYTPKELLFEYKSLIGCYHPDAVFVLPEWKQEDSLESEQKLICLIQKISEDGAVVLLQVLQPSKGYEFLCEAVKRTAQNTGTPFIQHSITYEYAKTAKGQFAIAKELSSLYGTQE